jgi:hypothetical protein
MSALEGLTGQCYGRYVLTHGLLSEELVYLFVQWSRVAMFLLASFISEL